MSNKYMKKADEWLAEQGVTSLKTPYYLPDLRVAFVEGMVAAEKAERNLTEITCYDCMETFTLVSGYPDECPDCGSKDVTVKEIK